MDFTNIVAETPYDEMGAEFAVIFGKWVNETDPSADSFNKLMFDLFQKRLELARKYKTMFVKNVEGPGGRPDWNLHYIGFDSNKRTYSFASPKIDRTKRFFEWCKVSDRAPDYKRVWNNDKAAHPDLPGGPNPYVDMSVWSTSFATHYGDVRTVELRRILYSSDYYLFEHPRDEKVTQLRLEAQMNWEDALNESHSMVKRCVCLATFEWLWFWLNPFIRAGALTGDAMSLIVQKKIGAKVRKGFYHQDCEALLLTLNEYVAKRTHDMMFGFVEKFEM